ncbi:MAG: glucose-6-phosphate dehydrogenase, partial [Gammaproteobacteria bacterium]|nr:glucose-6-phosphate dehydrogenase [Gammaproteobacteria bacterium]
MLSIQHPFELVLFGGNGDLSLRKLLPALFDLYAEAQLPTRWRVLALGRSALTAEEYASLVRHELLTQTSRQVAVERHFSTFCEHIDYQAVDGESLEDISALQRHLGDWGVRVFYLATRSDLYATLVRNLDKGGLISAQSRVVLEKPIGMDRASAEHIEDALAETFGEARIYRIDHYLGKETVQNLLVLRFANTLFENLWNQKYIDHIQITIAESIGVAGRADFYDRVGALRDMGQNHLLQLLCMTAMEPPHRLQADPVRD